jgi:hypothetical protein
MKDDGGDGDSDDDDSDDSLPSLADLIAKDRQRRALALARADANLMPTPTEQLVYNRSHESGLDGDGDGA